MESKLKQQDQDHYLFILLGLDVLYSINLKELEELIELPQESKNSKKKSKKKSKLELVFCHSTNTQPEDFDYPLGMGLFVHDSKLHFFGGEKLEKRDPENPWLTNSNPFYNNYPDIGLRDKGPLERTGITHNCNWLNKKIFSFTPFLSPDQPTISTNNPKLLISADSSNPLPNHYGHKTRPIVVTISSKVYALATQPFSTFLADRLCEKEQHLFEVFDKETSEWRVLDNPPYPLCDAITGGWFPKLIPSSIPWLHCVFGNYLLLQTQYGQFIFDANKEKWECLSKKYPPFAEIDIDNWYTTEPYYPLILAYLNYKDHLLVLFCLEDSYKLVAYPLAASVEKFEKEFQKGEFNKFFWMTEGYIPILNIDDIYKERNTSSWIQGGSISLVENNCICLVFSRFHFLHVCLLDINPLTSTSTSTINASVKAHKRYLLRPELGSDPFILSTFIFQHDPIEKNVQKSNQVNMTTSEKRMSGKAIKFDPGQNNVEESNQGSNGESESSNSVFLRNLPFAITTLVDILEESQLLKFGQIKPDGVFLNCKEHFAFVEFKDVQSLDKAIEASPIHIAGKKVYIQKAYKTSLSHYLWWRKHQKAFKKTLKA